MARGSKGNGHGRMHVTETPDVSHIQNPDVAHEHSDVSVGPILKFVFALLVFAIVVHLLMWVLFRYFDSRERNTYPDPSPMARRGDERLPPEPRLQLAPGFGVNDQTIGQRRDLSYNSPRVSETGESEPVPAPQSEYWEVRRQWEQQNSYGWIDESTGVARVPIERAKEMVLARGLRVRPSPQPATTSASPAAPPSTQASPQRQGAQQVPSSSSAGRQTETRDH